MGLFIFLPILGL